MVKDNKDIDVSKLALFPSMLWRMLHNQLWISLSRYRIAKGTNKIVDKGIEFDQVDRERDWDDHIMFSAILFYWGNKYVPVGSHVPYWRLDGVIITIALHHHYLYSRYHSHHHSSIVTEPITSVIHPFAEHIAYFLLFSIPVFTMVLTGTVSVIALAAYVTYLDFMNNMGHCNFELIPNWLFTLLPPLKYIIYTPSNRFHNIILQTWAIPKYNIQYRSKSQKQSINNLIEEAILEAEEKGARVLSLGLMNQGEELNMYGGVYMQKHPQLKVKLVDGSSLAVAVVLNSIPKGTTQVVLRGKLTKVACALAFALCQKRIQVSVLREDGYEKLDKLLGTKSEGKLVLSKSYTCKTWLVGDGLSEVEQRKASKGTLFIPFSQFPPKKLRTDCFYHTTPAMQIPLAFENVDSCENWLPRRVMSIWRIAGLVHALAGWEEHECGYTTSNIEKVWEATLKHGFQPLKVPTHLKS
ncbi:hypothetical protein ERO13_D04G072550v2 [Gossypium hirsutum]|nr:hypothetical protein ERO13_D04G072550v2 [Gossypium hirsutum]